MKNWKIILTLLVGVVATTNAHATPITITHYDIENAYISGTGGWGHSYSGTITTVGGGIANYSGGSGTLNNGIVETSVASTQLFNYPTNSAPVITLYFDGYYSLNSLLISGGNFLGNSIPGELNGLSVTIGAMTESFITIGQGLTNGFRYADDFIDFSGSSLGSLVTNQIVLSGFTSSWMGFTSFSIAEISIDAELASVAVPVPVPGSLALLGLGLAGLGFSRKKKAA